MIPQYKLSNLAEIKSGYTFREKVEEVKDGDVYLIQPKDFRYTKEVKGQDFLESSDLPMIHWDGRSAAFLQSECVLLPIRGDYREALYVPEQALAGSAPVIASSQFFIMYPKKDVTAQYLCWALGQSQCQAYLAQAGEGSALKSLKIASLADMPIPVPPKAVQDQLLNLHLCWQQERRLTLQLLDNREKILKGISQKLLKEGHL